MSTVNNMFKLYFGSDINDATPVSKKTIITYDEKYFAYHNVFNYVDAMDHVNSWNSLSIIKVENSDFDIDYVNVNKLQTFLAMFENDDGSLEFTEAEDYGSITSSLIFHKCGC